MYYLIAAILTSGSIIILFKIFEAWKIDNLVAITVNYLVAAALGVWLCYDTAEFSQVMDQSWLYLAVLSGFMLIITFLIYGTSVQKAGLAITSVAGKMSVIIPVLLGLFWFRETAGWMKIFGILLALLAFWLTFRNKSRTGKRNIFYFLPLLLFLGNGINDCLFKIAETVYIKEDTIYFLTVAFTVSLGLGLVVSGARTLKRRKSPDLRSLLAGVLLGVLNWYSTYFFLIGLRYFEVSLFIPVFNISVVLIAAMAGLFFFGQRLKPVNWAGIALALLAIILMAW